MSHADDMRQHQLDREQERRLHASEFLRHHPEYQTPKEETIVSTPKIPAEIRATVKAWFTSSYHGPQSLLDKPEQAVTCVAFSNNMDMAGVGWSLAGEADIVLRPLPESELVDAKVDSLRKRKTAVMAQAQAEATAIEGQIQQLLAITYEAPEVAL